MACGTHRSTTLLLAGGGLFVLAALVVLATPSSAHHTWYWTHEDSIDDVTVRGPVQVGVAGDDLPEPLNELINSETQHVVNLQYHWKSSKESCESMTWDAEGTSSFSSSNDPEDEGAAFAGHWIFDHRGYWTAGDNTGEHNGEKETVPWELVHWTWMGISFTGTYSVSWDDWAIDTTMTTTIHLDLEGYSENGLYMSYSGSGEGGIYRSMQTGPEPPDVCDTNGGSGESLNPFEYVPKCPDAVCEADPCNLVPCDPCSSYDCDVDPCDLAPCDYDPCENTGLCDPCEGMVDCDNDPCADGVCDLPKCEDECEVPCRLESQRQAKPGVNIQAILDLDPPVQCELEAD